MALSEFEIKKCEKSIANFMAQRRPPAHIRNKVDLGYRIENQSVEIFELRPQWRNESNIMEHSVAKATYVKSRNLWKVYWQRADLKWHTYDPAATVNTIDEFLNVVKEDQYGCFFG
jgi:hypothetical protein